MFSFAKVATNRRSLWSNVNNLEFRSRRVSCEETREHVKSDGCLVQAAKKILAMKKDTGLTGMFSICRALTSYYYVKLVNTVELVRHLELSRARNEKYFLDSGDSTCTIVNRSDKTYLQKR